MPVIDLLFVNGRLMTFLIGLRGPAPPLSQDLLVTPVWAKGHEMYKQFANVIFPFVVCHSCTLACLCSASPLLLVLG